MDMILQISIWTARRDRYLGIIQIREYDGMSTTIWDST